jgi:hypothetical protein
VTVRQQDAIDAVREAASEASAAGQLPAFLAAVEQVRVEAVLAAAGPREVPATPKLPGRVLTVHQAAARLGRSRWWVYRHKAMLPVTRFQTGGFGFDEHKLERWIEGRTR